MRILIVDDHSIVRKGIVSLLREDGIAAIFGEASDGRGALAMATEEPWDLIIADITMPGRSGLELIQDIRAIKPDQTILVLSAHAERDYAVRALKLGAAGYVSKQSASDVLPAAVRRVLAGGRYVSPALAELLADVITSPSVGESHHSLSNRELQVLRLIASGRTIKEIGSDLALSEKTVATYRARISEKMGLPTNVDLTRYAMRHGLVE